MNPDHPGSPNPIPVAEIVKPNEPPRNNGRTLAIALTLVGIALVAGISIAAWIMFTMIEQIARNQDRLVESGWVLEDEVRNVSLNDRDEIRNAFEFDLVSPVDVNQFKPWFEKLKVDDEAESMSSQRKRSLVDHRKFVSRLAKQGLNILSYEQEYFEEEVTRLGICPDAHTRFRIVSAFEDEWLAGGYIVYAYVVQSDETNMARYWLRKDGQRWKAYDWQRLDSGGPYSAAMAMVFVDKFTGFDDFVEADNLANAVDENFAESREILENVLNAKVDPRVQDRILLWVVYGWSRLNRPDKVIEIFERADNPDGFPGFHNAKAIAEYEMRQYEKVIATSQHSMSITGNSPESWTMIGHSNLALGRMDDANKAFANAFRCDPESQTYLSLQASSTRFSQMQRLIESIERSTDHESALISTATSFHESKQNRQLKSLIDHARKMKVESYLIDFYEATIEESEKSSSDADASINVYESLISKFEKRRESETVEDKFYEIDNIEWQCILRIVELADDNPSLFDVFKRSEHQDLWLEHLKYSDEFTTEFADLFEYQLEQNPDDLNTLYTLAENALYDDDFELATQLFSDLLERSKSGEGEYTEADFLSALVESYTGFDQPLEGYNQVEDKQMAFRHIATILARPGDEPRDTIFDKDHLLAELVQAHEKYRDENNITEDEPWLNLMQLSLAKLDASARNQKLANLLGSDGAIYTAPFDSAILRTLLAEDLEPALINKIKYSVSTSDEPFAAFGIAQHLSYFEDRRPFRTFVNLIMEKLPNSADYVYWAVADAEREQDHAKIIELLNQGQRLSAYRRILDQQNGSETLPFQLYEYRQLVERFIDASFESAKMEAVERLAKKEFETYHDPYFLLRVYKKQTDFDAISKLAERHPHLISEVEYALNFSDPNLLAMPGAEKLREHVPLAFQSYVSATPIYLFFDDTRSLEQLDEWMARIQSTFENSKQWNLIDNDDEKYSNSKTWLFSINGQQNLATTISLTLGCQSEIELLQTDSPEIETALNQHQSWIAIDSLTENSQSTKSNWPVLQELVKQLIESESPTAVYFEDQAIIETSKNAIDLLNQQEVPDYAGNCWATFRFDEWVNDEHANRRQELKDKLDGIENYDSANLRLNLEFLGSAYSETVWVTVNKIVPQAWGQFEFECPVSDDVPGNPMMRKGMRFRASDWHVVDFELILQDGIQ